MDNNTILLTISRREIAGEPPATENRDLPTTTVFDLDAATKLLLAMLKTG